MPLLPPARLFPLLLLLAAPALAQRAADGPPGQDPFGRRTVPAAPVAGGRYQSHLFNGNTLSIKATDGSILQVQGWARGVTKIDYFAPGRRAVADSSISTVLRSPAALAEIGRNAADSNEPGPRSRTLLTARHLRVPLPNGLTALITRNPLRVSLLQGTDTLVAEAAGAFLRRAAAPTPATAPEPGGTAIRLRLAPHEQLFGTGSRALPLNRRGYRLELYNQAHYASQNGEPNLNITLPVVLSSRGYLLFFDHHAAGYLDLGKTDADVLEYGNEGLNSLSYFVVTGRNQAEILDRYTALTGRQPLPPRWALGLIQSRFGYKSEAEMEAVATRMRRENFPLDALVLDLFWFGGTKKQGDFAWDAPHFPNPAGMMARLNAQGVKTVLISEPYVMRTSRNDSTVRTLGLVGTTPAGRPYTVGSFWAGPASILDVWKPATRRWLWNKYAALHSQGAAGWWSDLGEPENHPADMRHLAGPTRAIHNAYGQVWADIFSENYRREFPDERLFNLARSGWAGLQRNSVFPWSGDIHRSWSGLQAQVPGMVGMGQAGVGYMHSDAGGFCVGPQDNELYTRWLQMASLGPILRPHGEGVPPEPYFYPEPYKSAVRNATHLRYELLPYLYTLAWQNTTTGAPLVRASNYELEIMNYESAGGRKGVASEGRSGGGGGGTDIGPSDNPSTPPPFIIHNSKFIINNTQYLLGPNLLVAPVLQPGQRRRNVVLPPGSWISYRHNHTYPGGRTVGVVAPLAETPLLVRAGAFVPTTAYRPSTARYRPDTLLLRYYPDPRQPDSEFTLYDDDGHSAQALARHQYELLNLRGFYSPRQTDVLLSSAGEYPGQPVFRLLRLLVQRVAAPPTAVLLDDQVAPPEAYTYRPATHELEVHFLMNAGVAVSLQGLKLLTAPLPDLDPDALTLEAADNYGRLGPGRPTTLPYTRYAPGGPAELLLRDARGRIRARLPLAAAVGAHTLRLAATDAAGRPLPPGIYWAETAGQHQRLVVE